MPTPRTINALNNWALQVVTLAKANLLKRNKIATGELYNSVTYELTPKGDVLFYYDNAGDYVEGGRKPGSKFPPPPVIKQWIKIKGLNEWKTKEGKPISRDAQTFLISRAIAENGIKPFPFFTDPLEEALTTYEAIMEDALVLDIEADIESLSNT
jgi:hypothetical protein